MQFNSIAFMCFFPVVVFLYFLIPKKLKTGWLLLCSYYFYMSWHAEYAILIGGSTIITYISGLLMSDSFYQKFERSDKGTRHVGERKTTIKKVVMVSCIILNLGILVIFKYADFFLESINSVLSVCHLSVIPKSFDLLLPVGISFYTFQALGYVIDIYRKDVEAEKNFIRYALFVSFFPQLVAGPIERSKNLLNQIKELESCKLWDFRRITSGAILMVWGFFMKMVIADRISLLVNNVFENYRMFGGTQLLLAAVGFAIQIYCDFGSYSVIAMGAAKIMGFALMENFNTPYFARSIKDFWSRWHISLSTWFKDYLYIPLGGNRKGTCRKAVNLMVVFMVSGLWHGANWSFVFWGGIHGFYQIVGVIRDSVQCKFQKRLPIKKDCLSWRLLQTAVTFGLTTFAWIFFRSDTLTDAFIFIRRVVTRPNPWLLFNGGIYQLGLDRIEMNILLFSIGILFMVDLIRYKKRQTLDVFLFEQNIWFEWMVMIGLIVMIFVFGKYGPAFDAQQFIYFQF